MNAVFSTSPGAMGTCQNPSTASKEEKNFAPCISSNIT